MVEKVVPLSRRYNEHNTVFDVVRLRPPVWADYMENGRPQEFVYSSTGMRMLATVHDVVKRYADLLVVHPGTECLQKLDIVDTLEVEAAIIAFFPWPNSSTSKQTPSSGDSSAGDQATSTV